MGSAGLRAPVRPAALLRAAAPTSTSAAAIAGALPADAELIQVAGPGSTVTPDGAAAFARLIHGMAQATNRRWHRARAAPAH